MNHALYALFDDTIRSAQDADNAERRLNNDPNDVGTRAQLVHYFYNLECKGGNGSITEQRFRHIAWFIEKKPDLQFCGTSPFYINQHDSNWTKAKHLWQVAINSSSEEMRRVNACMFVSSQNRELGEEWLNSLFPPNSNNIWVLALQDLLCNSRSCFRSIVEVERCKTTIIDDQCKVRITSELKKKRSWEDTAMQCCESSSALEFKASTDAIIDLASAARIAGYSVFRFESNSILGFNPEAITSRFTLACWIIKHVPFSNLAVSHIFMSPFESPRAYDFLGLDNFKSMECLFEHLAELWALQLRSFPEDKKIANNATSFAGECRSFFPSGSKIVESELGKTTVGTAALKKQNTRRR